MHAAKNPEHEIRVAKVLSDAGFQKVIVSSSISNFSKWLPRLESAVVEAYLSDVLDGISIGLMILWIKSLVFG